MKKMVKGRFLAWIVVCTMIFGILPYSPAKAEEDDSDSYCWIYGQIYVFTYRDEFGLDAEFKVTIPEQEDVVDEGWAYRCRKGKPFVVNVEVPEDYNMKYMHLSVNDKEEEIQVGEPTGNVYPVTITPTEEDISIQFFDREYFHVSTEAWSQNCYLQRKDDKEFVEHDTSATIYIVQSNLEQGQTINLDNLILRVNGVDVPKEKLAEDTYNEQNVYSYTTENITEDILVLLIDKTAELYHSINFEMEYQGKGIDIQNAEGESLVDELENSANIGVAYGGNLEFYVVCENDSLREGLSIADYGYDFMSASGLSKVFTGEEQQDGRIKFVIPGLEEPLSYRVVKSSRLQVDGDKKIIPCDSKGQPLAGYEQGVSEIRICKNEYFAFLVDAEGVYYAECTDAAGDNHWVTYYNEEKYYSLSSADEDLILKFIPLYRVEYEENDESYFYTFANHYHWEEGSYWLPEKCEFYISPYYGVDTENMEIQIFDSLGNEIDPEQLSLKCYGYTEERDEYDNISSGIKYSMDNKVGSIKIVVTGLENKYSYHYSMDAKYQNAQMEGLTITLKDGQGSTVDSSKENHKWEYLDSTEKYYLYIEGEEASKVKAAPSPGDADGVINLLSPENGSTDTKIVYDVSCISCLYLTRGDARLITLSSGVQVLPYDSSLPDGEISSLEGFLNAGTVQFYLKDSAAWAVSEDMEVSVTDLDNQQVPLTKSSEKLTVDKQGTKAYVYSFDLTKHCYINVDGYTSKKYSCTVKLNGQDCELLKAVFPDDSEEDDIELAGETTESGELVYSDISYDRTIAFDVSVPSGMYPSVTGEVGNIEESGEVRPVFRKRAESGGKVRYRVSFVVEGDVSLNIGSDGRSKQIVDSDGTVLEYEGSTVYDAEGLELVSFGYLPVFLSSQKEYTATLEAREAYQISDYTKVLSASNDAGEVVALSPNGKVAKDGSCEYTLPAGYSKIIINKDSISRKQFSVISETGKGYEIISSDNSQKVSYNGKFRFKVKLLDGYEAEKLKVKVNGVALTPDEEGYYQVNFVKKDINIKVSGIKGNSPDVTSNPTAAPSLEPSESSEPDNSSSPDSSQQPSESQQPSFNPDSSNAPDGEKKVFTVQFVDYNGTVLKTEQVEEGKAATAPSKPSRKYYTFDGWDKDFGKITGDITVKAKYRPIKVKKIALTAPSKKIAAGKKVTLKAVVSPANALNRKVKWKSSNTKYATVNARGVVTMKKAGAGKKVKITAIAEDGGSAKASIQIAIMKNAVKKIKLSAAKSVKAGKKVKVKAKVSPTKSVNQTLTWSSNNKKYAAVNAKGVVTTKKAGAGKTVKITAEATDGSGKKAVIKIKIKK